jgi:hypothetical protein
LLAKIDSDTALSLLHCMARAKNLIIEDKDCRYCEAHSRCPKAKTNPCHMTLQSLHESQSFKRYGNSKTTWNGTRTMTNGRALKGRYRKVHDLLGCVGVVMWNGRKLDSNT